MSAQQKKQIHDDLELIDRFSRSYRQRFAELIRELNAAPTPQTGGKGLRLCVEAVDMLLAMQQRLADALKSAGVADNMHGNSRICNQAA